jgi:hypothetical protein
MSNLKKSKFNRIILKDGILWLLPSVNDKKTNPIFWDSEAFRPSLQENIKDNVKYKAYILFDKENLLNGDIIYFPRNITIILNNYKKLFTTVR